MTAPPEPQLDEEERRQFDRGVDEFNRGFYFECHDTIEDLWSGLRGPSRDFFQGLIQVSVAFYHLGNGNLAGADSMMRRALKRFERYPGPVFRVRPGRAAATRSSGLARSASRMAEAAAARRAGAALAFRSGAVSGRRPAAGRRAIKVGPIGRR